MTAIDSVSLANHLKEMRPGDTLFELSFELADVKGDRILLKNSTILCRERHSSKKEPGKVKQPGYRFEVFKATNKLGKGHFGTVYSIDATLALNKNGDIEILNKGTKKRIIKVVTKLSETEPTAISEVSIGLTVHYLHMKPMVVPTALHEKIKHYIIMRKIQGETLKKIQRTGTFKALNDKNKVLFAISLLKAVKNLHESGIFHNDINEDNILVNFRKGDYTRPEIHIIDFGKSKLTSPEGLINENQYGPRVFKELQEINKFLYNTLPGILCQDCDAYTEVHQLLRRKSLTLTSLISEIRIIYTDLLEDKKTALNYRCQICEINLEMSSYRDLEKEKELISKIIAHRDKLLLSKKDPGTAKNKAGSFSKIIDSFAGIENNLSHDLIAKIRAALSQENKTLQIHRHSCVITPFIHILRFFKPTMLDKRVSSIKLTTDLDSYLNCLQESLK